MWIFLLMISKVNNKGGVWELDLSPIKISSEWSILSIETFRGLCFPFEALEVTTIEGNWDEGTTLNSLGSNFYYF